jgi:hypothetical protein
MIATVTLVCALALIGAIGTLDGYLTWGDDYWRYGRLGCALRDAGWNGEDSA